MLNFKNIIFLLLVSDVSFGRFLNVDMKKCPKRNGMFQKIGSYCRSYYECTNWIPVEIHCPEDLLFNPISGWCDWIDAFTCLDKPKREECPRENGKFLKPGTKCKKYYNCCNGEPTEITCPSDTLFDPNNEKCEWPELYTCIEEPKRHKECPKDNGYFLKTGTDCQQYYHCINGNPTVKYCPKYQIYDPSQERCEWLELYTCVESISTKTVISSTFNPLKSSTNEDRPSISTETTNYETSEYPEVSSPETTFDPYTQSSTEDEWISTSTNYETSQYPDGSSLRTASNLENQYTEEGKTSSSFTDIPDYKTSQHPGSTSYRTSYPYTRSSMSELTELTTSDKTFQPYTKSSSAFVEETSQPVDIWCPSRSGYFPHPTDRHKFVACNNGQPTVMDCPSNLVYNQKAKRCDYK